MDTQLFTNYLKDLQAVLNRKDGREESFYPALAKLIEGYSDGILNKKRDVTVLPKATTAGNPDFRVWDGKNHITGYIEAKAPHVSSLDQIATSEQLKRYLSTFPNLILTNFYEFRLYQYGEFVSLVTIAPAVNAINLDKTPPLQNAEEFSQLLSRYFAFSLPAISDPRSLAKALAKRTSFLRDEVISLELAEEQKQGKKVLLSFYESFKKLLINNLTLEQFADLYAQTLTYGIFAARTRSSGEFNRELVHKYIPNTLGILKSIFKFISYEEPPKALQVLIDDIAEILCVTDIHKILHAYYTEGKGSDPIIHFYETFLAEYDPKLRESRGVYYTPEPVVRYIVRSIHSLLKTHFGLSDGLASPEVTILDPAAGTLTFPAEAIKLAISEYSDKYGEGSIHKLIKEHILPHFHAIELMMAPYTVGHLKISYLLAEYGYEMAADERFKLYLSNTLEPDTPAQLETPFTHDITEECTLANKVKHQDPILVIMGNPPYSYMSGNINQWTESLLKTDLDGAKSYFTIDGQGLNERNPKGLQDDYVKFLRFAQWKIHKAGKGIVGMITNHGYLDNPTFRGMRQSLLNTFDEIYVLDLHGNSLKKEKCPDGGKDENVFDIRQGTAIVLMIKGANPSSPLKSAAESGLPISELAESGDAASCGLSSKRPEDASTIEASSARCGKSEFAPPIAHHELYGLRSLKYDWLVSHDFDPNTYAPLSPGSPFYLFHPEATGNEHYLNWLSIKEIISLNSVGLFTARDHLTIKESKEQMNRTILHFASLDVETARKAYSLGVDTRDWKVQLAQSDLIISGLNEANIRPILYRPFDIRYSYYTGKSRGFHCMPRGETMKHMLEENISIICNRQTKIDYNHAFISSSIVDLHILETANASAYVFPLYLYPDEHKEDIFAETERQYNIQPQLLEQFRAKWQGFEPEQLFYYIYAVLHSPFYRQRYAQYLRMDFPRIPFTADFALFTALADLGKALADLHLLKSPLLSPPLVRYQGQGANDTVDELSYDPAAGTLRINPDKYFEGITPELWNFHIGGYQVMHKYLKDRKGKTLADPIHYCRIATALAHTIRLQTQIDLLYKQVDGEMGDKNE